VVIGEILAEKGLAAAAAGADVLVGYMDEAQRTAAMRLARALRAEGRAVDLALAPERKPKRFFSHADRGGFREAAFIGPDDVAAGAARLKNLARREERPVAIPAA
jgi:histidyl-tRNA synthetase